MTTRPFTEDATGMLPELRPILMDDTCLNLVADDALAVHVVDTVWGRDTLFDKIAEVLDRVHSS